MGTETKELVPATGGEAPVVQHLRDRAGLRGAERARGRAGPVGGHVHADGELRRAAQVRIALSSEVVHTRSAVGRSGASEFLDALATHADRARAGRDAGTVEVLAARTGLDHGRGPEAEVAVALDGAQVADAGIEVVPGGHVDVAALLGPEVHREVGRAAAVEVLLGLAPGAAAVPGRDLGDVGLVEDHPAGRTGREDGPMRTDLGGVAEGRAVRVAEAGRVLQGGTGLGLVPGPSGHRRGRESQGEREDGKNKTLVHKELLLEPVMRHASLRSTRRLAHY